MSASLLDLSTFLQFKGTEDSEKIESLIKFASKMKIINELQVIITKSIAQ
jgi:hypothetical protein